MLTNLGTQFSDYPDKPMIDYNSGESEDPLTIPKSAWHQCIATLPVALPYFWADSTVERWKGLDHRGEYLAVAVIDVADDPPESQPGPVAKAALLGHHAENGSGGNQLRTLPGKRNFSLKSRNACAGTTRNWL